MKFLSFLKCSHPLDSLVVNKEPSVRVFNDDFLAVTLHFRCEKCKSEVVKEYLKPKF